MKSKMKMVYNVAGFKFAWLASVMGAVWGVALLGPVIMTGYIALHFRVFNTGRPELLFLAAATVIGTLVDSLKAATGFITYAGSYPGIDWLAPIWISGMWAGFALTLNHSLGWLKNKTALAAFMGAVFGPLAYIGGEKIGGVALNYPDVTSILVLAAVWGSALPLLFKISENFGVSTS